MLGAEPWSESLRQKIEQAWGEFDACDIYGLSEIIGPGVSCECIEAQAGLHVNEDHFLVEVVDPGGHQEPTRAARRFLNAFAIPIRSSGPNVKGMSDSPM